MILQQLHADADAILKQTGQAGAIPSMYVPKLLRWVVEIDSEGRVPPRFTETVTTNAKGKEIGIQRLLPDTKRTVGITPFLLADTPAYALGWLSADDLKGKDEARERARAAQKFAAFRALAADCARQTDNPDVQAIADFLSAWNPQAPPVPIPKEMTGAHTVTFRVDYGPYPIDDPAVRRFWAARGQSEGRELAVDGMAMQCLLTGARGLVEDIMPVAVKGIPNGQPTGTHLVSANFAAAESYGLKRAQTSPICRDAGEQFGKALNALLASERHRVTVQNVAYVFWAAEGTPALLAFAPQPDPKAVRHLFDAVHKGVPWSDVSNAAKFHVFGLSANAARAVVRSALETTIGDIGRAQMEWFQRLAIIGTDGQPAEPLGLKTLSVAPYRAFKEIAPGVEDALVQAALMGAKLPQSLLATVVTRCRMDTERRVTAPRAALLKYILTQDMALEVAEQMSEEITGEIPGGMNEAAYHCGRLFAELEDIQRQALPGLNATIGDKYFGSASASPASVFGILLAGVQNHLSSLRKSREGAWHGAQRRLEEILAQIGDFPKTLPLREQALFSLGYYHHRAAKRKDITARSEAKKRAGQSTLEAGETEAADLQAIEGDTE